MSASTGAENEARIDEIVEASPGPLEGTSPPGPINRLIFLLVWLFGNAILRTFFRLRVTDPPRLQPAQPYIIAANHISYLDPIALQAALRRRVFYLMTERIYRQPAVGWFFRFSQVIPVRESALNRQSLRRARSVLDRGDVIGIFPEGGISRSGELRPGRPGIGALVLDNKVTVVPAAIAGTNRAFPPGAIVPRPAAVRIVFGSPLSFDDLLPANGPGERRRQLQEVATRIMAEIEKLQRLVS